MNGFSFLALVVLAIGIVVAYRAGMGRSPRDGGASAALNAITANAESNTSDALPEDFRATGIDAEKSRLIISYEAECARLRREITHRAAENAQLRAFAEERRQLFRSLADARGETARYRQVLVDLENNTPPPLLDSPAAPDDLRLIVGIGPVLERMLQQLGINSYRQIARWTERDIDDFNARLPEFPGRIRRDAWVTQARALHQAKYGEILSPRGRT